MPVAQVTVDFVNPPKEGKKFGSIKTKELAYVSVKPSDLGQFTKGSAYQIEYTETAEGYKNFVRIVGKPNGAAPNGARNADSARDIFVTGVVGRAMGSGKFGMDEIGLLTAKAVATWEAHLAPKKVEESPY